MSAASAYEAHAREFLAARDRSPMGADIVRHWARSLPAGTEVVEIACGGGYPVTRALLEAGVKLWAIDASPTLLETFRARFPDIPTQCSLALDSDYFGRKFGAAVSIGLLFLLEESEQVALLRRVSEILQPGGRFLFTAPVQTATWLDLITGRECRSLGEARYAEVLESAGFRVMGTRVDEGENNYYHVQKLSALP
jgi:cyclopropane fatty-acyl-phospholipid synthase-like methyltransferase